MKKSKTINYREINIEIYISNKLDNKKVKPYMTYLLVKNGIQLQGESIPYKNKSKLIKAAKVDIDDWKREFEMYKENGSWKIREK